MLTLHFYAVCIALTAVQQVGAIIVERPLSAAVTLGKDVTFYCTTDDPSTNIEWCLIRNFPLDECNCFSFDSRCKSSRYVLKNVTVRQANNQLLRRHSLTVVGVARQDVGKYTCRENNSLSNVSNAIQCAQLYAFRAGVPAWNVTSPERARQQLTSSDNNNIPDDGALLSFTFDTPLRAAVIAVNVNCRRSSDGLTVIQERILSRQKQWSINVDNETSTVTYNCTTEILLTSGGCHEEQIKYVDAQLITILEVVSEAWAITANVVSGVLGFIVLSFIAGLLLYGAWKHFKKHPRSKSKTQQQENGQELKPLSVRDEKSTFPDV